MFSTLELERDLQADDIDPSTMFHDDCYRLTNSAGKELGALIRAVTTLYKEMMAIGATEDWIALVNSLDISSINPTERISRMSSVNHLRIRSLVADKGTCDKALPEALVTGYEHLIASIELPDQDDRHVLAAAIRCDASVIVTLNIGDFPSRTLATVSQRNVLMISFWHCWRPIRTS
ncbi:hypothetical protein SAMN05421771_3442 [Granulicella pectinivorans]|uniref:PIN domain-containing protein n=1 Tax=Granulicella pectinivorans TaxID=474950 RepID=A0A1I6MRN9_9BACT|nr:hypothetical protein [Granulicella pectinivorans]SFS18362.1 hypothetical protein SAMN05421771_3442 [Granulicella pectinivorans]